MCFHNNDHRFWPIIHKLRLNNSCWYKPKNTCTYYTFPVTVKVGFRNPQKGCLRFAVFKPRVSYSYVDVWKLRTVWPTRIYKMMRASKRYRWPSVPLREGRCWMSKVGIYSWTLNSQRPTSTSPFSTVEIFVWSWDPIMNPINLVLGH